MVPSTSASHAKAYFSEALAKADYYLDDQELAGKFEGKLAARLGIEGTAMKEAFHALAENINPSTGDALTARTKDERRVGYDVNFHCPKSVSVLHALSKDDHLLHAFELSVSDTMREIEADAKTRVRTDNRSEDRATAELCWASFTHQTARPVEDALPDPHLHAHCFVFNATWDEEEKKYKAGQFGDVKRDMPYYQARFHKRLSDNLIALGYRVKKTDKSFEVEGVPEKVIDLFSKRTSEIGQIAKERGITDAKELDALGARTRAKKQKGHTMAELKEEWKHQIREIGEDGTNSGGNAAVRFSDEPTRSFADHEQCVSHAIEHGFERASVLDRRKLLASAYRYAIGDEELSLDGIDKTFNADSRILQVEDGGRTMCTTHAVLAEEKQMVALARKVQAKLVPLYLKSPTINLEEKQKEAVLEVLTTTSRVSIIRGKAGTGKTTLMKEAVSLIEKAGKQVTVVAPSAQASRDILKSEGFAEADTVARLLADQNMQEHLQGQVLWVDEAGLLGTKDMKALLALADRKNARIILAGDTRQHASVARGDALRILNTVAGIKTAEVSKIYRQRNEQYRKAVEDLAEGNVKSGFERLEAAGFIHQTDPMQPGEQLAADYVQTISKGKSALIVSPTHEQGEKVTGLVREKLRKAGLLGKKEIEARQLKNLNLTEAEKADWRNFKEGQIVQFNQNQPGIRRGSLWRIEEPGEKEVLARGTDGKLIALPLARSSQFDVLEEKQIALAKGDKVRITRNGFDRAEKRLNNGDTLEVMKVSKKGAITLVNAKSKVTYELDQDFGHLAHAHCITSQASQGKTVDEVFIHQPAATFDATDAKQFYVSVSRGRDKAHIYTDDKDELVSRAARLGDRKSALELTGEDYRTMEAIERMERSKEPEHSITVEPAARTPDRNKAKDKEYGYEPGF